MKSTSKRKCGINTFLLIILAVNLPAFANNYTIEDLKSIATKANDLEFKIARNKDLLDHSVRERTDIESQLTPQRADVTDLDKKYKADVSSLERRFQSKIDVIEQDASDKREIIQKDITVLRSLIDRNPGNSKVYSDEETRKRTELTQIIKDKNTQVDELNVAKQKDIDALYSSYNSKVSWVKSEIASLEVRAKELDTKIFTLNRTIRNQNLQLKPAKEQKMYVYNTLAKQRSEQAYIAYKQAIETPKQVNPFTHKKVCGGELTPIKCKSMAEVEAKESAVSKGVEVIVSTISELSRSSSSVGSSATSSVSSFSEKSKLVSTGKVVDWVVDIRDEYSGGIIYFVDVKLATVKSIPDESKRRQLLTEQKETLEQYLNLRSTDITPIAVAEPKAKPINKVTQPIETPQKKTVKQEKPQSSFGNNQSLTAISNEESEKLKALREKEDDSGWGFGTYALIGGGAIGAGLALAGGEEEEPEVIEDCTSRGDCPEEETDYSGTYTVELSGTLSDTYQGICNDNAAIIISNVSVSATSTSTSISMTFGTTDWNGTINSSGSYSISGNTSSVSSNGFVSTDAIEWAAFSGSFSNDSSFTSNSFELTTFENGIPECSYQVTLSGNR